jgi:hypothetical protein
VEYTRVRKLSSLPQEPVYDKGEPVYLKEQDRFTVVVEWKLDLSDYGYKYVIKGENGNKIVKRSDLMSIKEAEEAGHKPKDNEQHDQ